MPIGCPSNTNIFRTSIFKRCKKNSPIVESIDLNLIFTVNYRCDKKKSYIFTSFLHFLSILIFNYTAHFVLSIRYINLNSWYMWMSKTFLRYPYIIISESRRYMLTWLFSSSSRRSLTRSSATFTRSLVPRARIPAVQRWRLLLGRLRPRPQSSPPPRSAI